jgi:cbb3-type cytochrome oxidase subunit 3
MSVIPLTLTISLCLVFTFVVFFLREHNRQRFSSAESDALLPLADEMPRVVKSAQSQSRQSKHHGHTHGKNCGCKTGERPPCAGCRNLKSAPRASSA